MREILFHGKREDTGEWVEGYYTLQAILLGTIEEEVYPTIQPFNGRSYNVIPGTVGQYAGLTDKNNVKIFEGDIVKATLLPAHKESPFAIGYVVFENGTYKIHVTYSRNTSGYKRFSKENAKSYAIENNFIDRNYCLEVIGNFHDNPELLNWEDQS